VKSLLAVAALLLAGPQDKSQDKKSRPFHLGVTPFAHDLTAEAVVELRQFMTDHADLVAQKLDEGVPWPEALGVTPFDPALDKKIEEVSDRPEGAKLLLSTTPLNGQKDGLAGHRGALGNLPLPGAWGAKDFDDPSVARAYLAWCREIIRRAKPDFFVYVMEGAAQSKNPARWKKFVPFVRDIYGALKKEFPALPLLITIQVEAYYESEANMRAAARQLLPYSDFVTVTALPNLKESNPAKLPKDYFSKIAALAPGKPFAVAETAFLGEDLTIAGFERVGKAAWQDDYLRWLLDEAAKLNAKLVVWTVPRDYDALYEKFLRNTPLDFLKILKDTGLLDGQGKPRKAFGTWQAWLKAPRK
jgi:hypothetical protein